MSYLEMEGKKVLVSGAANGIGASVFLGLLVEEVFPIGIDLEPFEGSELQRKLDNSLFEKDKDLQFFTGDASDEEAMKRVLGLFNRVDGLVNNAGLLGNDNSHDGRSLESLNKMMRAHVQTAFILTELAYPKMTRGGSIVNIGSIELAMAAPNMVLYTAAKGAMLGMTVAYAATLGELGIRVNMVSPGNVNTERNSAQYKEMQDLIRGFEGKTPLGRSVEPHEITDTVLFLLSRRSGATTGQDHVVDCGYTRALWDPSWTDKKLGDFRPPSL